MEIVVPTTSPMDLEKDTSPRPHINSNSDLRYDATDLRKAIVANNAQKQRLDWSKPASTHTNKIDKQSYRRRALKGLISPASAAPDASNYSPSFTTGSVRTTSLGINSTTPLKSIIGDSVTPLKSTEGFLVPGKFNPTTSHHEYGSGELPKIAYAQSCPLPLNEIDTPYFKGYAPNVKVSFNIY